MRSQRSARSITSSTRETTRPIPFGRQGQSGNVPCVRFSISSRSERTDAWRADLDDPLFGDGLTSTRAVDSPAQHSEIAYMPRLPAPGSDIRSGRLWRNAHARCHSSDSSRVRRRGVRHRHHPAARRERRGRHRGRHGQATPCWCSAARSSPTSSRWRSRSTSARWRTRAAATSPSPTTGGSRPA